MPTYFDADHDSAVHRRARKAYNESVLRDVLPDLQLAARGCGYAIAVHGSLARDVDLIAIPWVENAQEPELLVRHICGILAGVFGRALALGEWSEKPHGRRALTIIGAGDLHIDLSLMPQITLPDCSPE